MSDDATLLRAYLEQKSEAAFTELVQRHLPLVYGLALRRVGGDAHLAQDVAQTVFTDLARKARTLSSRDSLSGWLYVAAHDASATTVRAEQQPKAPNEPLTLPENESARAVRLTLKRDSGGWRVVVPLAAIEKIERELAK